jgi:tetratricopeptide (TPR) repeat protein
MIDRETQKPGAASGATMAAVLLRVRVLEVQNRKPELASYLDSVVSGASTIEQAAEIENLAQQKSLEAVRQHALEKQATLASDPVTRLQLRYTLARLYESRKAFAAAQRNVESLYHDNPKILGVVRSTADFYWRMKQYPQAIAVLQQASKDAYPELGKQFAFEAARKSTEARFFPQAREILAQLQKDSPYDSQYLAAMADTYAQSGDQQGLKQFYLDKIGLFRNRGTSSWVDSSAHAPHRLCGGSGPIHRDHQRFPRGRKRSDRSRTLCGAVQAPAAARGLLRQNHSAIAARLSLVHGSRSHPDQPRRFSRRR